MTPVAPGHRNGCWGLDYPGPNTALLNSHVEKIQRDDGTVIAVQIMAPVTTNWRPGCGHDELRNQDPSCEGCKNQNDGS